MSAKVKINSYWTPWEHEVCSDCYNSNPYSIWLVKLRCFQPHRHQPCSLIRVVLNHEHMAMQPIRRLPKSFKIYWFHGPYKFCVNLNNCPKRAQCLYAHSQSEIDMWNIKKRLDRAHRDLIIGLSNASLQSQCPSEVCRTCFEANPKALWLAWLKCTNTEKHQNKDKVVVIAISGVSQRLLVKVRPLPAGIVELSQVERCPNSFHIQGGTICGLGSCSRAHTKEELLYWQWEVAKQIFEKDLYFRELCSKYEYPEENSAIINSVLREHLVTGNYKSKYHKLVYLEKVENSRKIITECDSESVQLRLEMSRDGRQYLVYLMNLSYTAMDYASHTRADVVITLAQSGRQYTAQVRDTPDFDKNALVLRIPPQSTFFQLCYPPNRLEYQFDVSVHFEISQQYYQRLHKAIDCIRDDTLAKLIPSKVHFRQSGSSAVSRNKNISGFSLDETYQFKALKNILSCNPSVPYLLLGPFGTGKTYLLAATVAKLVQAGGNQVLVCTHLNRGADGLYRSLQEKVKGIERHVARVVGSSEAADNLRLYSNASVVDLQQDSGSLYNYSVLVTTFGVALGMIDYVNAMQITHILIDEGAQCPEPEALGALVLASTDTKIIIVGDNKQVGPQVRVLSEKARNNGLGESLLERIFSCYKAMNNSIIKTHTSTLLTNYRCHPSILMLASSLFYECTLISESRRGAHLKAPYPLVFACTSLKQGDFRNCPPENEAEAKLLISKMLEYIHSWPTPPTEPIGLLASTKQQVACLRKQWRNMKRSQNLRGIQVEIIPTYNIQGEEFSAVFLSTSEPTDAQGAPADRIKSICNKYVFNTVITRAQSLIVVAGNPFFLLHMGSHYKINCWTEYIRRCVQCQSFIPPANFSPLSAQSLPKIIGQICEKVLLSESIQQLEDKELNSETIDLIMERYISDLNDRREYKLATRLIQSPSGDMSWIQEDSSCPTESGILWCQLDCKNFREAVANPLDSKLEPIKLSSVSVSGRRGTFHEGIVKVDTIHKRVLFDEETEVALSSTHFGVSFPCRVDPKNPILFFPLDHRYPKFVNLPMLLVHTCKGVICFDPNSINNTPKVSNFIPLEVAAKMIFVVKFLGWQNKYPYPLGIIIAALPPGHSCYTGELALRISNNIPLGPCLIKRVPEMQKVEEGHMSHVRIHFSGAFTIDPKGSADHDDALTCRLMHTTDKGSVYEIGVHIIDVQSCIPKDSELDKQACKRGCSSYRSSDHCISSMLPEQMVQNELSIVEDESRNTLSVFAQYLINKDGSTEEVPNSIIFKESQVHCALGLTYEEAQQILFREPNHSTQCKIACYNENHENIEDQLAQLWKIALFIRQNRLGKDAAYSFTLDEPEKQKCPEAHYLIEELMIWANNHVAIKLLKTFPEQTILRVQDKPPDSELANLRKNHGEAMTTSLGLRRYVLPGQMPVNHIQILQSVCAQIRDYLNKKMLRNALHCVQFEHLHPQIAVATVGLRQSRKASGTDYIVSELGTKQYWHDTLQCAQYTHFTSPIRRYIDIIVQRLLCAAIHGRRCPYSKKELAELCEQVKKAIKNSNNYDRDVKRLDLATSLDNISQMYISFIQQITEDAEVDLTFADPHLKVLYARERLIALKHLNAQSIPTVQGREMSPPQQNPNSHKQSSGISITESVTWQVKVAYFKGTSRDFFCNHQFATSAINDHDQKRCADISLFVPEGNIISEHSNLDEHKIVLNVVPYTHSMPQEIWAELQNICKLDISLNQDQRRLTEILLKTFSFNNQPVASSLPQVISCHSPLLIYKLCRPIQTSEVLQVQMTASTRNSILSPSLQLIEVGPELRICVQHNNNPAECFADRLVEDASKRKYPSIGDYFRCWEQVLLSEAVSESLSESELLIVKDVTLKWPKLDCECDSFGQVVYKLVVPPGKKDGGVVMKLPSDFLKMSYDFFKFDIGDLLCVRYDAQQEERNFGFVFHMVIHHSEMQHKTMEHSTTSSTESATFYLKFVGPSSNSISPEIAKLLTLPSVGVTLKCEIQLLPLTLPFRRIYSCLHDLRLEENVSPLAKQVALGTAKTTNLNGSPSILDQRFLTQMELSTATSLWPFQKRGSGRRKKLNGYQKKALDIACSNSFTLIQGPPGTGKSVTGAHMAYTLAKKLRKERSCSSASVRPTADGVVVEELKPCVMYCGPSNQAVNVVLDILTQHGIPVKDDVKILRVFSKTIEQEKYSGPKLHEQVFRKYSSGTDSKCEPHHKPFALHELVRKLNHRITELESEFIQLHRKGKIPSKAKQQEYYRILAGTEKSVLRGNVDIVLCTCNEASSKRIRATLKPVYCIVDECGMSTEPECMVPIQRAEHVILIGDHQQLRPVIKNHSAEVKGLGTSLFERYVSDKKYAQIQEPHMLEVQYRMHPELCKFPSKEFYEGKLKTDGAMIGRRRNIHEAHLCNFWPQGEGRPFVFVNLVGREGGEHTGQRGKTKVGLESKFNKDEARKIADIASVLVMHHHVPQNQIAALTPYSAQKDEIKKCLLAKDQSLSKVQVKTVTESQGSEYGIVLLSTVRSKPVHDIRLGGDSGDQRKNADIGWILKNLGFVRDSHQICVGITRCKYGLVIVGNKALLSYSDVWSRLIKHYAQNDCVVNAKNFP